MDSLEALAHDVAKNGGVASEQPTESVQSISDSPDLSPGLPLTEPVITVSPRPGFENDPFLSGRPRSGGRGKIILAGFVAVALVGGAFAWQSTSTPVAQAPDSAPIPPPAPAEQVAAAPKTPTPKTATVTAPAAAPAAPSPDLVKQLDAITQDLASIRRGLQELTAKQQQIAAAQQQLDQLAAKQEQLAARQDQTAQSLAKLQSLEQAAKPKASAAPSHQSPAPRRGAQSAHVPPPPPSRTVFIPPPPRLSPDQPLPPAPAQAPPPSRAPLHPVPPAPVPQ
jgi:hypothetical protein